MLNKKIFDRDGHAGRPGKQGGKFKKSVFIIIAFIFCFSVIFVPAPRVSAQYETDGMLESFYGGGYGDAFVDVGDTAVRISEISSRPTAKQTSGDKAKWAWEKALEKLWEERRQLAGAVFKKSIGYFLNRLAYDTATYLATGDKGQKPMFHTQGWSAYFRDVADNAAGHFLETLGRNPYLQFNLCEPDFQIKMKIGLGLKNIVAPEKPECTFSEMRKNWSEEITRADFLPRFQNMFDPRQNDLGIALSLYSGMEKQITDEVNQALLKRLAEGEFKSVTDPISGLIKTPSDFVRQAGIDAWGKNSFKEQVFTGTLADAIDIFINTLAGKMMDQWLKQGLVTSQPDYGYQGDWGGFGDYDSTGSYGGVAGAKARFRTLIEPQFGVRGDYNILSELTSCPDPAKAGPTNCVITENFRQAVSERKTVGEAITDGYLDPNGTFGFNADGLEPSYMEGYPYRSMIILRKFRILPSGWEVAAQYIKDHPASTAGAKNLGDLVACFSPDDNYDRYPSADWCRGLVDPNWVLKAPLNYCRREGPGPEIRSSSITGRGNESELNISRNDNYCADEQTCIKENSDGSCDVYGYCTEERRKWNFNANSCDPNYNTCQTFRGREGQTVSFLENTLDYGNCGPDSVGCLDYCEDYDYAANNFTCTINTGDKIYLDKDAEKCDARDEGCHEFIRTAAGAGANLLKNSSFEEIGATDVVDDAAPDTFSGGWGTIGLAVSDSYLGSKALRLASSIMVQTEAGPAGFVTAGETYTLSLYAKGCAAGSSLRLGATSTPLNNTGDWAHQIMTYTYPAAAVDNFVDWGINVSGGGLCTIDAVKLERGKEATAYSDYRENGLVYLKFAPETLGCDGQDDDPAECAGYVRRCGSHEIGCELYTSVSDGMTVPARVSPFDYCPAECAGYDEYLQTETWYDASRSEYLIPKTAQKCGADSVGCDEFTNLDKLEQGGEAREYYSYLRLCNKPSSGANCTEFYTWEGSNETGYQLKVHPLSASGDAPEMLAGYDTSLCTEAIYNLSPLDVGYDPDCREFYGRSGNVFYRLYSWTITCSDDCHPYRRTLQNYDSGILSSGECSGADMHWDATEGACIVCKNGGAWNDEHGACIYEAVPGESRTCSAARAGCREYTGTQGSNMRIIVNNDFEGSTQGWTNADGTAADLSGEAQRAGGNSLLAQPAVKFVLGARAHAGNDYVLKFIAKSASGIVTASARMDSGSDSMPFAGSATLDTEWGIYELSLTGLDHAVTGDEAVIIEGSGEFYIDEVRLTEITDRYYLIRDSWNTPASCDQDIYGEPWAGYMLGCDGYRDKENAVHYLHNFSSLCQESAVGCEIMIDTANYSGSEARAWNDDNGDGLCDTADELDCEAVEADNFIYAVYNSKKACNAVDKGCERLGKPYRYGASASFSGVYLRNNPDIYDFILCDEDSVGCEEWAWKEDQGSQVNYSYFNDPGDQVCEWRAGFELATSTWNWYQKKAKKCDTDGSGVIEAAETQVCLNSGDCPSGACILDQTDHPCPITPDSGSQPKTIGLGGPGNRIFTPTVDMVGSYWAGLCPAAQSGCTEYIDPVSRFSVNTIFNSDFSQDVDANGPDGWTGSSQDVRLKPYTLYRLAGENTGDLRLVCDSNLFFLDEFNNLSLSPGNNTYVLPATAGETRSRLVYSNANESGCSIELGAMNGSVELKPAVIDYQLRRGADKTSCNGIVNFEDGCILFNERRPYAAGANPSWDADLTIADGQGVSARPGASAAENDANTLLKVEPDRECREWLACRSYIKDEHDNNICFNIGLCDSLDGNNNCDNFLLPESANESFPAPLSPAALSDKSGYTKAGYNNNSFAADYLPLGVMDQAGELASVPNGNFEFYGGNGYPIGWTALDAAGNTSWSENNFKAIANPVAAQAEGVKYPQEGRSFLKFSPSAGSMESEFIDVEPSSEYILSGYMNTKNFQAGSGFDQIAVSICIATYDGNDGRSRHSLFGDSYLDITECENQSQPWYNGCCIGLGEGHDWTKLQRHLTIGSNTRKIKITIGGVGHYGGLQCCDRNSNGVCPEEALGEFYYYPTGGCTTRGDYTFNLPLCPSPVTATFSSDTCAGNIYVDDVKLRPGLNYRYGSGGEEQYRSQDCRLYPSDDALACEYYEESGKYRKGMYGYCLEYDRYPGSYDTCLLWWPVDKVKGEGIEESAGYSGKFPVYYCAEAQSLVLLEKREPVFDAAIMGCDIDWLNRPPSGNYFLNHGMARWVGVLCGDCDGSDQNVAVPLIPVGTCIYDCGANGSGWYVFDGFELVDTQTCCGNQCPTYNEASGGLKYYNPITGEVFDDSFLYCNKIVQAVDSVGHNKYWSGRVYEGSDYRTVVSGYRYGDYSPPFGSIAPPYPPTNPYEWDGSSRSGVQPLTMNQTGSGVSAGRPYYVDTTAIDGIGFIGICNVSTNKLCLKIWGVDDYNLNKADCAPGEGVCQPLSFPPTPESAIQRLFAQSYGYWIWSAAVGRYVSSNAVSWSPPPTLCPGGVRPDYPNDWCAIAQQVQNIRMNGSSGLITANKTQTVNLTFNSRLDNQEMPMTMYHVDWGDNEHTTVTGVEMRPRPDSANPHSFYHLYSYWDLKAKHAVDQTATGGTNSVYCGDAGMVATSYGGAGSVSCPASSACCTIRPRVKLKDNWDWCNAGIDDLTGGFANPSGRYDCNQWAVYGNWITVTER